MYETSCIQGRRATAQEHVFEHHAEILPYNAGHSLEVVIYGLWLVIQERGKVSDLATISHCPVPRFRKKHRQFGKLVSSLDFFRRHD